MATHKFTNVALLDTGDKVAKKQPEGKIIDDFVAPTAVVALNDVIIVGRVPVDALITGFKLHSSDWGTTGLIDIGFHKISGANTLGAVIDADALATDLDVKTAALTGADQVLEVRLAATLDDAAWSLAGLSARPDYDEMFLTITASEASTATDVIMTVDIDVLKR